MATTYYLRDANSSVATSDTDKTLDETRGDGSNSATGASTTSSTGTQLAIAGTPVSWWGPPLAAQTISAQTVSFSLWGFESSSMANQAFRVLIELYSGDGATLRGVIADISDDVELGTTGAALTRSLTSTARTASDGDRIRVRVYTREIGGGVAGFTTTLNYDGTTAGAAGDSSVTFANTLTPQGSGTTHDATATAAGSGSATASATLFARATASIAGAGSVASASLFRRIKTRDPIDFETNDLSEFSTVVQGDGLVATSTAAAKNGTYGLHIDEPSSAAGGTYARVATVAHNRIRAAGWFRTDTEGAAGNNNANLRIFAGGIRIADVYRSNSTGEIWLRTQNAATTLIFTNTGQVRALDVWYHLDLLVEYNGAGAVSRVVVKVDGVTRIDASTFDLRAGSFDEVQVGAEHSLQYVDIDVDDLVIYVDPPPIVDVAATLSGSGATSASPGLRMPASYTAAGAGTASAAPILRLAGASAQSGSGTITGAAFLRLDETSAQAGAGSTVANLTKFVGVSTAQAGAGTMTGAAAIVQPATAAVSGSGSVAATAIVVRPVSTAVAGTGAATGQATLRLAGEAAATGAGQVSVEGGYQHSLTVSPSGSGATSASLIRTARLDVATIGTGNATADVGGSATISGSATGTGSVSAAPGIRHPASVSLAASGAVAASTSVLRPATTAVAGSGTLSGTGTRIAGEDAAVVGSAAAQGSLSIRLFVAGAVGGVGTTSAPDVLVTGAFEPLDPGATGSVTLGGLSAIVRLGRVPVRVPPAARVRLG